jgi:hypothetical protein
LQGVASAFALGILVLSPGTTLAQAVCGNMIVEDGEPTACVGDCDNMGSVTVDEIVTMVNLALSGGNTGCAAGDADNSGSITVDEIVTAVNNALNGCPSGGAGTAGEDCDNGGLCVCGGNAGTACDAEDDCMGNEGACFGGPANLRGCTSNEQCPEGTCRKCRPYGGDGCSATCTFEVDRAYPLVPGIIGADQMSVEMGTSGAVVFGPFLTVPLELSGTQVITAGEIGANGQAAVVLKVDSVDLDRIPVAEIACACVRGAEARTCGGVLFDAAGVQAGNCTPGFDDIETCPTDKACAPVHGPGNTGSGFISCGDPGFDIDFTQDCNGTPGQPPFDPVITVTDATGTPAADDGSGFFILTSAIGTVVGRCTGTTPDYGADGEFCTDDDPVTNRGAPNSIPFTTATVGATVLNPGNFEGDVLAAPPTSGAPFTCGDAGTAPTVAGANIAGGFTSCDQPTVDDIAVPVNFAAQP